MELTLLCDTDGAKAAELSRLHNVPFVTRFEDCLRADVDAVDISTPNHLHVPQALAALEAGKHVLIQKPMGVNAAECARVVGAGRAAKRVVGMFMSSLSRPAFHEMRDMIAGGALGRVTMLRGFTAHRNAHTFWPLYGRGADYWRRRKECTGGGGMALIGIHMVNLVPWLAGSPVESVAAFSDNLAARQIMDGDDVTVAACRLESGALATLEAGYSFVGNSVEVYGEAGSVRLADGALAAVLESPWKGRMLDLPGGSRQRTIGAEEMESLEAPLASGLEQREAFARAVLEGRGAPVPGEAGVRDVAVLEAIYRSARSGRMEKPVLGDR
jgi:predicted dehydrogenase